MAPRKFRMFTDQRLGQLPCGPSIVVPEIRPGEIVRNPQVFGGFPKGLLKLAAKELEQALRETPENLWISYYLARAYFGNNNRGAAWELAKTLVREHAEFSRGHFLLRS